MEFLSSRIGAEHFVNGLHLLYITISPLSDILLDSMSILFTVAL